MIQAGAFKGGHLRPKRPSSSPRVRSSTGVDPRPAPAEEFAPLAAVFRRRLLVGLGSASAVAVGANFAGVTSFLLGFAPELGRQLKLDALYPVQGFTRCINTSQGFEFVYPASWVGDQTLLYRAAGREESQRALDPPPLDTARRPRSRNSNEPVVAFGPPGSSGELNVSVIVSPVAPDFSIEAFGGAEEVGAAVVRTIAGARRGDDGIKASLVESKSRADVAGGVKYYEIEFAVETPTFRRHNVAVCCVGRGSLFTLNAQAPESEWAAIKEEFYNIADSFTVSVGLPLTK